MSPLITKDQLEEDWEKIFTKLKFKPYDESALPVGLEQAREGNQISAQSCGGYIDALHYFIYDIFTKQC